MTTDQPSTLTAKDNEDQIQIITLLQLQFKLYADPDISFCSFCLFCFVADSVCCLLRVFAVICITFVIVVV